MGGICVPEIPLSNKIIKNKENILTFFDLMHIIT